MAQYPDGTFATLALYRIAMFQVEGIILPSGKLERVALLGRYHIKLRGKVDGDKGHGKWLGPQGECNGTFLLTRAASG